MLSSTAVFTVNAAISFSTLFVESLGFKPIMSVARDGAAQRTAFTETPVVYYLRRERTDRHRIANIYDHNGTKIYTIERRTVFTPVWSMLTVKERREVATLHAGFVNRYFDFNNKQGLCHRDIAWAFGPAGLTRRFHLNDGAAYEWRKGSKFLERIINPGSGEEEVRQRVAKVRQLRTMSFEYEILVDESMIDRDIVLVTAYIAMLTQWGIGSYVDTRGPTLLGHALQHDVLQRTQINSAEISNFELETPIHAVELIYAQDCTNSPESAHTEIGKELLQKNERFPFQIESIQYIQSPIVKPLFSDKQSRVLERSSDCNGDVN